MASINFVSNTYSGEVLEDLLTYTAQGNDAFEKGLIHIESGIQYRKTLPHIQLGTIIQDRKATPISGDTSATRPGGVSSDSVGTYSISERYLEPKDFMIYLEFNPRDYEQYWRPFQPEGPLVFRELDPRVQAKMLKLLIEGKNEYVGSAIWCSAKDAATVISPSGLTAIGGNHTYGPMKYWDGAVKRILFNAKCAAVPEESRTDAQKKEVASGVVKVVGTTALTTGEGVEAALAAIWKVTPAKLRNDQNMRFIVGYDVWTLYDEYLSAKTYKYTDNTRENVLMYKGKKIVPVVGVPEQTILFGKFSTGMDSNLWMGVDYSQDYEAVQVERLQANSELYFFKANMKMDVNIVKPGEVMIWTPYTHAAL